MKMVGCPPVAIIGLRRFWCFAYYSCTCHVGPTTRECHCNEQFAAMICVRRLLFPKFTAYKCLQIANITEVRLYANMVQSDSAQRYIHVKTNASGMVAYFAGNTTATPHWDQAQFDDSLVAFPDHNANFPQSVLGSVKTLGRDPGDGAMTTNLIRGYTPPVQCDNDDGICIASIEYDYWNIAPTQWIVDHGSSTSLRNSDTIHQIWVRTAPSIEAGKVAPGHKAHSMNTTGFTLLRNARDYGGSTAVQLGFDFKWFGNSFGTMHVSNNAYISFGTFQNIASSWTPTSPGAALLYGASPREISYVGTSGILSNANFASYKTLIVRHHLLTPTAGQHFEELRYAITFATDGEYQYIEVRSGTSNPTSKSTAPNWVEDFWGLSDGYSFVGMQPPPMTEPGSSFVLKGDLDGWFWAVFNASHLDLAYSDPPMPMYMPEGTVNLSQGYVV